MPRALASLAASAVLALAACGGSSDDPIEVTKQFIEAYDTADTDVCDELVTERYLRSLAEEAGSGDGHAACVRQVEALEPAIIRLDVVPSVEERGDTVDVVVRLIVNGAQREQEVTLRRVEGELRVDRVDLEVAEAG